MNPLHQLPLAIAPGGLVDLSGSPASFTVHPGVPVTIIWSNVILLALLAAVFVAGLLVPLFPGRAARIAANRRAAEDAK